MGLCSPHVDIGIVDVTVKPPYGRQEGAVKGYNPHKPGRPCQTYHTYMIGNLRLVLDVEVLPGDQGNSKRSLPGLMELLARLPEQSQPRFVRGDCDWGTDRVMTELEKVKRHYLFKMKKSPNVKTLISLYHSKRKWVPFKEGWEAKEATVQLSGWETERRVVLVRRQLKKEPELALEYPHEGQQQLAFLEAAENVKAYEYSALVTNMDDEVISIAGHYGVLRIFPSKVTQNATGPVLCGL